VLLEFIESRKLTGHSKNGKNNPFPAAGKTLWGLEISVFCIARKKLMADRKGKG
jgi:hypothetical protein